MTTGTKLKTLEAEDGLRHSVQATASDLTARVIRFEVKGKVEITTTSMAKKKMTKGALDDAEKIKLQHKIVQI